MSQNSLILVAQSYLRVIVNRYPRAGRGQKYRLQR